MEINLLIRNRYTRHNVKRYRSFKQVNRNPATKDLLSSNQSSLPLTFITPRISSHINMSRAERKRYNKAVHHVTSHLPIRSKVKVLGVLIVTRFSATRNIRRILRATRLSLHRVVSFLTNSLLSITCRDLLTHGLHRHVSFRMLIVSIRRQVTKGKGRQAQPTFKLSRRRGHVNPRTESVIRTTMVNKAIALVKTGGRPNQNQHIKNINRPITPVRFTIRPLPNARGKGGRHHRRRHGHTWSSTRNTQPIYHCHFHHYHHQPTGVTRLHKRIYY